MTYSPPKPSIYPQYCFGAAPTYNVSSFLKITDISILQLYRNIPGVHFYGNLPVRWVRIVGVIVGVDDFPERRVYTVDDSSGLNMQCVLPLEARQESSSKDLAPGPLIPSEYSELTVGHVVDLRGPIVPYRGQKAIKIRRMKRVPTTQHELLLWERRLKFKTEVLNVPWALSDEEIRGYRRKAEQADSKDLNLAATKRKRGAQREGGQAVNGAEDDFKIRKRVANPASASTHNGAKAHLPGRCTNGANVPPPDKPALVSQREASSRPYGDKPDPYSIKGKNTTRRSSSPAPKATPSQKSSIHDDPFKITKKGSRRTLKVPSQLSARPSVESRGSREDSSSCIGQSKSVPTRASGDVRVQPPSRDSPVGRAEFPNPNREKPRPAPKSKVQNAVQAGSADDPYVIKTSRSRRAFKTPTTSERSTSADPFEISRSCKGPCSDKSPNVAPVRDAKRESVSAKYLRIPLRHGGSGTRFDVDDPFKITKAAGK